MSPTRFSVVSGHRMACYTHLYPGRSSKSGASNQPCAIPTPVPLSSHDHHPPNEVLRSHLDAGASAGQGFLHQVYSQRPRFEISKPPQVAATLSHGGLSKMPSVSVRVLQVGCPGGGRVQVGEWRVVVGTGGRDGSAARVGNVEAASFSAVTAGTLRWASSRHGRAPLGWRCRCQDGAWLTAGRAH